MMKKLLIGLTPLMAFAVLATVPVASQAIVCKKFEGNKGHTPKYCDNATLLKEYPNSAAEKTPTISWGKLSLGGASGVACKNAVGGNVWNPEIGGYSGQFYTNNTTGIGEQETVDFATYECTLPVKTCPYEARVIAENLPWPGILREGGETAEKTSPNPLRLQSNHVRVSVGCFLPLGSGTGIEGEPLSSAGVPYTEAPGEFAPLNTSGGPEYPGGVPETKTPEHPGEGENAGALTKGSAKCNTPGTTTFQAKSGTPPNGDEGSGELEQEVPFAEVKGEAPGKDPGFEGRGTLLFQTRATDVIGPKAEIGYGIGVKAITEGTVKTCGFLKQEEIGAEEE